MVLTYGAVRNGDAHAVDEAGNSDSGATSLAAADVTRVTEDGHYKIGDPERSYIKRDDGFTYNSKDSNWHDELAKWKWLAILHGAQALVHLPDATAMYEHYWKNTGEPKEFNYENSSPGQHEIVLGGTQVTELAIVRSLRLVVQDLTLSLLGSVSAPRDGQRPGWPISGVTEPDGVVLGSRGEPKLRPCRAAVPGPLLPGGVHLVPEWFGAAENELITAVGAGITINLAPGAIGCDQAGRDRPGEIRTWGQGLHSATG